MRTPWAVTLLLALAAGPAAAGDDPKPAVPKEVRAMEGTYAGSWTMHGIDAQGEVVRKQAWTDTLKSTGTEVKGDRAYVTWANEQTFAGVPGPPRKVEGREGVFLTKDGTAGDAFIEMFGQTTRMVRLADNVWTYAVPASAQELTVLGFPKGAAGQHVVVKVVTTEQGVETHRISRLTTATWKDKDGKERVLQFVSLHGHHKRRP